MSTLYISGRLTEDKEEIVCPLQSSVVLFIIRYCQAKVKVIFVPEDDLPPSSNACSYKIKNLPGSCVDFLSWQHVPNVVRNVTLPCVHQLDQKLVRSGLCVVLRHIIRDAHNQSPSLNLIDLLGFRQGSMKMCAEVSSWTKLCEVDIPFSVMELIANLKELKPHMDNMDTSLLTLPQELTTLEKNLNQNFRVHNDNKRQRAEIKQLKEFFTTFQHKEKVVSDCVTSDEVLQRLNTINRPEESSLSSLNALSFDDSHIFIEQTVQLNHGVRRFTVNKKLNGETVNTETNNSSHHTPTSACDIETKKDPLLKDAFDFSNLNAAVMELSFKDIEYEHVYSEGIELTIADLILITYIYHLLNSMDFALQNLPSHLPSVLKWAGHMACLAKVNESGQSLGWNMERLRDVSQHNSPQAKTDNKAADIPNGVDSFVTFQVVQQDEEEEVELSRCAKMNHKALKPEVLQALSKFETVGIAPVEGTHPKGDEVRVDWDSMPDGVHPKEGYVPQKRTQRKCQQLENLATAVQTIAKPGDVIVDFCSGGGHLGILCAYLLPQCQVYLVENKEESLLKSSARLESLGLENVALYQCNMDYFTGRFDVGLCLHACGTATDMVLELCTKSQASFVICPCCYGGIHETHLLSYPRSNLFLEAKISYTDFLNICHAADQTEFDIKLEKQGRTCMNLVDTDRAEYAKQQGYNVSLCSLKPLTCSPKNNLLIGTL